MRLFRKGSNMIGALNDIQAGAFLASGWSEVKENIGKKEETLVSKQESLINSVSKTDLYRMSKEEMISYAKSQNIPYENLNIKDLRNALLANFKE